MIKILILLAIVVLSAMLGMALSNYLNKRMQIIGEFYDFNEKLLMNMKYGRNKLSEILKDYPEVEKAYIGEEVIGGEEGEFFKKYLSGIGVSDAYSQTEYLNEMKKTLSKFKSESEEKYKKYGPMYFKLCLAGGILIAVLIA